MNELECHPWPEPAQRPTPVWLVIWLVASLAWLAPGPGFAGSVTVFAAASLKNALDEIADGFSDRTGHDVILSLAGSSALARQIQAGAPADVFISANADWMDHLAQLGRIEPGTRFDLTGNQLVLVAPAGKGTPTEIRPDMDLSAMLGDGRLAMALVQAVPAGIYGKQALEHLGLWDQVNDRVAQADNVRAALALVALGEAPLGIVYATDARAEPDLMVIGTFPPDSHPQIRYPVAAVTGGDPETSAAFLEYLRGDSARAALQRQGFAVLGE